MRAALQMSRLLISTKRPPAPSAASEPATMPLLVRLLSTTLTPPTSVTSLTKAVSRELLTWAEPSVRSSARLAGLPAVVTAVAPAAAMTCMAARPTPPAAACTSTRSADVAAASWLMAVSTVMNTVGMVAASSKLQKAKSTCKYTSARVQSRLLNISLPPPKLDY